jgi:hypothetical protein
MNPFGDRELPVQGREEEAGVLPSALEPPKARVRRAVADPSFFYFSALLDSEEVKGCGHARDKLPQVLLQCHQHFQQAAYCCPKEHSVAE